jgi:hypothetical protein
MAKRRNDGAAPRPLDWDALVDGDRERLPAGLSERSALVDPVGEAIARASAGRGGGP